MSVTTKLSREFRADLMRSRMHVIVCSDGRQRNALRRISLAEQIDGFWAKVQVGAPLDCWLWLGATCGSDRKYGQVWFAGRLTKAHRVAYEIAVGPIPAGLLACHKCDVPLCVNPNHLFVGTQKDNIGDMMRKGRNVVVVSRGEENARSIITTQQVLDAKRMRNNGRSHREIAAATGISKTNVGAILQGRTWTHVQCPPLVNA